jgi:hypothetical protein
LPAASTGAAAEGTQAFAAALQLPGAYDFRPGRYEPERGPLRLQYKVVGPSAARLMQQLPDENPLWAPTIEAGDSPALAKCVLGALLANHLSASEVEVRARVPITAAICGLPEALCASTCNNWPNGGKTIEKVMEERGIKLPPWPANGAVPEATENAWRDASREFAEGASGNVRVLQQHRQGLERRRVQGADQKSQRQVDHPGRPQNWSGDFAMEKIDANDAAQNSEALVIWVGPIPALGYDREAALGERFGAPAAAQLAPILRTLEGEFASTNAADVAADLREMHELAFADFKRKHPELSDQAVHALAARYTYENR